LGMTDPTAKKPEITVSTEQKLEKVYRRHVSKEKFGLVCYYLQRCGSLAAACAQVGITPQAISAQASVDPESNDKLIAARALATGSVEARVWDAATNGTPEPVVYRGQVTSTIRKPSDELAMFWLKSHMPEVYDRARETRALHLHAHAAVDLSDEQLAQIANGNGKDNK